MKDRNYIYTLILIFFIQSCVDSPTCDQLAVMLKNRIEYNFVLTSLNINGHDAYIEGTDLKDKTNKSFLEGSGWIAKNANNFKVGDTICKKKGEYSIIIHRKKKVIVVPCQCGVSIYRD